MKILLILSLIFGHAQHQTHLENRVNLFDDFIQTIQVEKENKIYSAVVTPQHSSFPNTSHYAFNFENSGWVWNQSKGCWEIFMEQSGFLDLATMIFHSIEKKKGAHNIQFHSFGNYQKFLSKI